MRKICITGRHKAMSVTALSILLLLGVSAQALTIDPTAFFLVDSGSATVGPKTYDWDFGFFPASNPTVSGYMITPNSNLGKAGVAAITGDQAVLAYKDNLDVGEEGPLIANYDTVYAPVPDPSFASISWTGGVSIDDPLWLEVKDGRGDPSTYLFDISFWDGMETIELVNFWLGQGSISHVAIWVGDLPTDLMEPPVLGVFALALLAMAMVERRRGRVSCPRRLK